MTPRHTRPAERWRDNEGQVEFEVEAFSAQRCKIDWHRGSCRTVRCDDGLIRCARALGETGTLLDWPGKGAT